ncbi:unnamed protein product [Closterium sp. NIES-53]
MRHPCSPRDAPTTPHAASAAPRADPAAPCAAPAAREPLASGPLAALAARAPPACGPPAAPAARASPACGLPAAPAARAPPIRSPLAVPAARSPPACDQLTAPAARSPPPLRPTCRPFAAREPPLFQPARRHLKPARRPLRPACRPLLLLAPPSSCLLCCWPPWPCAALLCMRATLLVARHPSLPATASLPSLAPPTTADSATRSQWLTRDAAARLAIRNHLPLAECAHFRQHKTAKALYDAVVARYSSPATTTLGRLLLPYLFPELSAFATVEDLVTHLRTSNARYHATLPAEFLDRNPPPRMYITLCFIVTWLPNSLRSIKDHFLALDPTDLTVDLLEQHLLAAETSVVAVGAVRGTPRTPFFEGCSPSPLAPSYASVAAVDVLGAEDVRAASASGKRRSSKGKVEVVGTVGVVAGVGALVAAVVAVVGVVVVAAVGVVAVEEELIRREGLATCRKPHTPHRCFSRLDDAWREEFGDKAERPRWAELLRSGVAIFDLDYDTILAAMYALSDSAEGDCYLCVPPDPGIEAAALGASESALPGTAPAEALHTITLDSSAFPLLADPSGGPVLARSSTVLPCLAVPSSSLSGLHLPSFSTNLVSTAAFHDAMVTTTTPGGQRVSICTCTRTGCHLATFTRLPESSLYTLATEPPQVAVSAQVSASGPVAAPCSCRLLSHQTLLWHHRLGHPSLPRLRGMHSCHLVSGLPRGGEFSSDLVQDFCRGEGILLSFTLPASPQQNGIAECRIGLVMEVARTSIIHAAAPHFLWPFAVWYAAHQLNLWPRVSLPETSPTLRWTGKVGDASVFRVWGSRTFVRDTSADKLSPCLPWLSP